MRAILVTTCTGRKKIAPLPSLLASTLSEGKQDDVLLEWLERISDPSVTTPASDVYCGRGFAEILKARREYDCEVHIISAGLGLITSDVEIPSYNLTISPSLPESIQRKVKGDFNAPQWWRALNGAVTAETAPLAAIVKKNTDAGFLFSLSRPYAEMVVDDLLSLRDNDLLRVRLLGLSNPDYMPKRLRNICMPYDGRFDGPDNAGRGTRSDFPQRVACHFLQHIYRPNENHDPHGHAKLVSQFLEGKSFPKKVKRATQTDDQIRAIIRERWDQAKGASSKMLRVLRDDLLVCCEQKRFAQLFREVRAERNERT